MKMSFTTVVMTTSKFNANVINKQINEYNLFFLVSTIFLVSLSISFNFENLLLESTYVMETSN